eukprot:21824-Rhodomonas_salina.1
MVSAKSSVTNIVEGLEAGTNPRLFLFGTSTVPSGYVQGTCKDLSGGCNDYVSKPFDRVSAFPYGPRPFLRDVRYWVEFCTCLVLAQTMRYALQRDVRY